MLRGRGELFSWKKFPSPPKLPLSLQKTLFRSLGGERGAPVRTVFDGPPVVRGTFFVPGGRSGGKDGRGQIPQDGAGRTGAGRGGWRPLFEADGLEIYAKGHPSGWPFVFMGMPEQGRPAPGDFLQSLFLHQADQVADAVGVAPFVVVPGHDLHQIAVLHGGVGRFQDGGMRVALEVHGDQG